MPSQAIQGKVTSAELCAPLKNVRVARLDKHGEIIEETTSGKDGGWAMREGWDEDRVRFEAKGFVTKTITSPFSDVIRLLEDRLIGYQDRLWFNPSELIPVYIHSPVPYTARLFRHGPHKKCILDLGEFKPLAQQVPDGLFVENGLAWKRAFNYRIPPNAEPGIYSLLLEAPHLEPFAIPFVVSTPENHRGKRSKLLVLASTNTWQSYNLWGGRSRYRNFEEGRSRNFILLSQFSFLIRSKLLLESIIPERIKSAVTRILGRFAAPNTWPYKKLTIRRPFTNCQLEGQDPLQPFTNHLAGAEWRILAWLEREGIGYDLISGYELHHHPKVLRQYQAIILSTHSEYWTREMYETLAQHHNNHGLWIFNLSANTMYREIEFYPDGSTRCTSLSFADSCTDETQLLGVRITLPDYGTCAPYKILVPGHWVFKGIPMDPKSPFFGKFSLNQRTSRQYTRYDPGRPGSEEDLIGAGASGWEMDKLSKTAPKDFVLIAKGANRWGGADMVIREPSGSRGGVFSASSLIFGGALLIDDVCSKITKNVISRSLS